MFIFNSSQSQMASLLIRIGIHALVGLTSAGPLATVNLGDLQALGPTPTVPEYNITLLYAQYAAAAYCNANNNITLNPSPLINCSGAFVNTGNQSNCAMVEAANATTVLKFNLGETPNGFGTAGYVAVDVNNGLIVLAFRGTDPRSTKSFPTNQQAATNAPVPFPLTNCPNCAVTDGYLPAFQVVNKTGLAGIDVIGTVMNLTVAYPTFQVVVAGHSLGGKSLAGAISTIAAIELRRQNVKVHLASFGMPRVANPDLANFLSAYDVTSEANPTPVGQDPKQRNFRFIHAGDGTPDTIALQNLRSNAQFRHIMPSFNITSGNNIPQPPRTDIQISSRDGISQLTGVPQLPAALVQLLLPGVSAPVDVNATSAAHKWYLGFISACF